MPNKSTALDQRLEEQNRLMADIEANNAPITTPAAVSQRGEEMSAATPVVPVTNEGLREANAPGEERSFWDPEVLKAAVETEWVASWALAAAGREELTPDPNFRLDTLNDEDKAALFDGLPEDLWDDAYLEATSLAHAKALRKNLDEVVRLKGVLDSAGVGGWSMQMLAAIFDPAAIAATVATEGVAAPAIWGAKIGRGARAVRAGLLGGGVNAGIEGYLATQDPTRSWKDVLFAGTAGFALGGAFGAIVPGRLELDARKVAKGLSDEILARDAAEAAGGPRAAGADGGTPAPAVLRPEPEAAVNAPQPLEPIIENLHKSKAGKYGLDKGGKLVTVGDETWLLYRNESSGGTIPARSWSASKVDPKTGKSLSEEAYAGESLQEAIDHARQHSANGTTPNDSVGAARTVGWEEPMRADAEDLLREARETTPETSSAFDRTINKARWDMVGRLMQSDHPMIRKMATMLSPDGAGTVNHGATAAETMNRTFRTSLVKFYRDAEPGFKAWLKENGGGWFNRFRDRDDFMTRVGKSVRHGAPSGDPHVDKVAASLRRAHAELLQTAKDAGVRGFEDVLENGQYLMRVHNARNIRSIMAKYGSQQVYQLVGEAIRRNSPELSPEDALKIGRAYIIRAEKHANGADLELNAMFSRDSVDTLRAIMKEEIGDEVTDEWIERTALLLQKRGEGIHSRAKHRMGMDETHSIEMTDLYNTSKTRIGIEDLLENNAEALFYSYTRGMSGAIGMASVGFRGTGEFASLINKIKQTAPSLGKTAADFRDDISKLETIEKVITGKPLGKNTKFSEAMQQVRDFNFMRVMGQVGFAQLAEIGNLIGQAGWKASLTHMPALLKVYRRAKSGEPQEALFRDLEAAFGMGADRMLMSPHTRMDETGLMEAGSATGIPRALRAGARFVADASFMNPINIALERMAGRALVQRMAEMAHTGAGLSAKRLRSMGLGDEALAKRVMAQMRKHVGTEKGMLTGHKVNRLNLEKWDDVDAKAAFITAVDRWSRRVIQKNDVGDLAEWMTSDFGRIMAQFRNFMMVSWAKQLINGLAMRDFQTYMAWMLSMVFGGLAYTGQTALRSIGRSDQEEFLAERLDPKHIALSAFQRAGFSSILPMAVDTAGWMTGTEMPFQYGRSTGLQTSVLGNPTTDLFFQKLPQAARGVVRAATDSDYDFSQKDLRNITGALAFQNVLGITNALEALGSTLPEKSQ